MHAFPLLITLLYSALSLVLAVMGLPIAACVALVFALVFSLSDVF